MPQDMQLVQVQYILRHGARYPTLQKMEGISEVYELLKAKVPRSWIRTDLAIPNNAALLVESGRRQTAEIAKRMAQRYPLLMPKSGMRTDAIRFVSSDFQRTVATGNEFRHVVDSANHSAPLSIIPLEEDNTIAMKFSCPRWTTAKALVQPDISKEQNTFDNLYGKEIQNHISYKLGISAAILDVNVIQTMYELCGYDVSLYDNHRHWCSLFNKRIAALLELRGDIKYSRVYGLYSGNINKHIACSLFTEIMWEVDRAIRGPSSAVSIFRFGHAETIMFINNILKLDRALGSVESPIAGNMSFEDILRRGFRTSKLIPFSSNLGIELYKGSGSQFFFRLLLNERAIRLPECAEDLCQLSVLRKLLATDIGCDYNQMCRV
ncbi:phosphoglycerate mutase-like protein [Coemansia reversa NRRL 1564]|uniref:Multiple inositol polyphosphate phosphatase 1 n=1 Tax=Coemansia reversa (strain ATCC 12441 / NRRL 1564) TaxID=763665 RepID=A0A2G5B2H1_COERN|nr:phosphoglycerate mutase-like protein [Coemansia reversa NRRL 1564]|eukprot:PIA13210.1 phosphoglycerate mutase-like protein [Coemansia reversa NRRL 1564]